MMRENIANIAKDADDKYYVKESILRFEDQNRSKWQFWVNEMCDHYFRIIFYYILRTWICLYAEGAAIPGSYREKS